jgi:isoquinoline 1-oxidoreductase alpha subunit
MADITFTLNGQQQSLTIDDGTPLLWVLREHLAMTGTKFGCGMGLCGACTVHLDGSPIRSCSYPADYINGRAITTIEGLTAQDADLHPVQQAWLEMNVPQCGYCQSGQIMSAVALLAANASPSDADIDAAMSGNICRCGTYPRIRKAIHRAADLANTATPVVQHFEPKSQAGVQS